MFPILLWQDLADPPARVYDREGHFILRRLSNALKSWPLVAPCITFAFIFVAFNKNPGTSSLCFVLGVIKTISKAVLCSLI